VTVDVFARARDNLHWRILRHDRLSNSAKVVGAAITMRVNRKTKTAYPSIETLQTDAGQSKATVQKGLKELIRERIFRTEKEREGRYWHNVYHPVDFYQGATVDLTKNPDKKQPNPDTIHRIEIAGSLDKNTHIHRIPVYPLTSEVTSDKNITSEYASRGSEGQEPPSSDSLKCEQERKGWPVKGGTPEQGSPQGTPKADPEGFSRLPKSLQESLHKFEMGVRGSADGGRARAFTTNAPND